jgi:hypothetical protein
VNVTTLPAVSEVADADSAVVVLFALTVTATAADVLGTKNSCGPPNGKTTLFLLFELKR